MLCPNECKRLQFQTLVELIINECTEKKIITLQYVHPFQLANTVVSWIKDELKKFEIWLCDIFSRQRHRYIVSMLGICVDNRLPYIVSEFVDGQSVKYYIDNSSESLTWPQRVKIVRHFTLSMQFIYAANNNKPAILHLDPLLVMSKNIILHLYCACSNLR